MKSNIGPFVRRMLSVGENVSVIYTLYKRVESNRLYMGSSIDEVLNVVDNKSPIEINKFVKIEDEIKISRYFVVNGKFQDPYVCKGSFRSSDIGVLVELVRMN